MSRVTTTTISDRFAGPPFAANGGYTAGLLAERLGVRGAHVALRAPVPLDTPVEIDLDGPQALISRHGRVLASAAPVSLLDWSHPTVDFITAAIAAGAADRTDHPFPACFVCGPARGSEDGMHLLPGRIGSDVVAASWRPTGWQADPTGTVSVRMLAAALDCPSAFPFLPSGGPALLASMTFEIKRLPRVGEDLVVTGWKRGSEGRKHFAASAVASAEGETLARANTLWIALASEDLARVAESTERNAA